LRCVFKRLKGSHPLSSHTAPPRAGERGRRASGAVDPNSCRSPPPQPRCRSTSPLRVQRAVALVLNNGPCVWCLRVVQSSGTVRVLSKVLVMPIENFLMGYGRGGERARRQNADGVRAARVTLGACAGECWCAGYIRAGSSARRLCSSQRRAASCACHSHFILLDPLPKHAISSRVHLMSATQSPSTSRRHPHMGYARQRPFRFLLSHPCGVSFSPHPGWTPWWSCSDGHHLLPCPRFQSPLNG